MNKASGNVLFLILIAVALFAALAYAVTQSTRSGGGDVSKEKMQLTFDEMQNVVVSHRTAIQRMIMGGVRPNDISTAWPNTDYNNSHCTSNACQLYLPSGGGLSYYNFLTLHPGLATQTTDRLASSVYLTWVANHGTTSADLVYLFFVTEPFCNFINNKLGISTLTSAMSNANLGIFIPSSSNSIQSLTPLNHADAFTEMHAPHLKGREEGCYKSNTNFIFYAFLYPT